MQELWSSASYELRLLSAPLALAPATMLVVIAFIAALRGAPALRGWLLGHMLGLLPYAVAVMLSPSIGSPAVAELWFRIAAATIPLAAACGTAFQLALVRRDRAARWRIRAGVALALGWLALCIATDLAVGGVAWLDGLWFPVAGAVSWLGAVGTLGIAGVGFAALGREALGRGRGGRASEERRQQRAALIANAITYGGLIDVALSYGVGSFPIGWILSSTGSLLVARAMVVEDLLRTRAIDTRPPLLIAHFAAAALLGWLTLAVLGAAPWWVTLGALALVLVGARACLAALALLVRRGRGEGPLERLLAQLRRRARDLTSPHDLADLASEIVEVGIGARPVVLIARDEAPTWAAASGARLTGPAAPEPRLADWLATRDAPVFADDLEPVPAALREAAAALLAHHGARAVVPARAAGALVALVALPAAGGPARGRALAFVARAAERLAEALVHARMARRAAARATLAREVALAATVQTELLPGPAPHALGEVAVVGAWRPATRCAGDFWGVHALDAGRALLVIGDATGHGVAAAMITAAAAGAGEVCARRCREPGTAPPAPADRVLVELVRALDAAVRRVGGGQLELTCFAAIFDPAAGSLAYVSCGHPAPYLCRAPAPRAASEPGDRGGRARALAALAGRGSLLGGDRAPAPRVHHRAIAPGDLVVCYTDGVIDAKDPAGVPFGDRRLQRLLEHAATPATPGPAGARAAALRAHLDASVVAHRAGEPPADDETVVVAEVAAPGVGAP